MTIQKKGDPPLTAREQQKLMIMRQASSRTGTRYTIDKRRGGFAPKPVTLPPTPWDKK